MSRDLLKDRNFTSIPVSEIDAFPDNPFRVRNDEDMRLLIDSIRANGVINPVIVRKKEEDGRYELISGHRRKKACEQLGIQTIPATVAEVTRDEAIILLVDSNEQRSVICPCDKGRAYMMKLEAMKRLPGRPPKENGGPVVHNYDGQKSRDILAEVSEECGRQIQRYIRLTSLIPELQDYVDEGKMKMRPAIELSYLDEDAQRDVVDCIIETDAFPSHDQAIRIRRAFDQGYCTYDCIRDIMDEQKPNQKFRYKFNQERLEKLIPQGYTSQMAEDLVCRALEFYKKYLKKQRETGR